MNTTGCPDNYAHDDFFPSETPTSPCTIPIPLYIAVMAFYTVVLAAIAASRTQYIIKRAYNRKKINSKTHGCLGRFAWLQLLTITQSWLSAIGSGMILIFPLTFGTGENIMTCLIGIQFFLYSVGADRWLTKLIRLGSRIIGPNYRGGADGNSSNQVDQKSGPGNASPAWTNMTHSSSESRLHHAASFPQIENSESAMDGEESAGMRELRNFDRTLVILMTSIRVANVLVLVLLSIVSMVFPKDRRWLEAGIGIMGYEVYASMCVALYQYQRCKNEILLSQKRVERLKKAGESLKMQVVVKKFTQHQFILLMFGHLGALIHVLWAVEVIPISFSTVLGTMFFDAMLNGSMLFTFFRKSKTVKRNHQLQNDKPQALLNGDLRQIPDGMTRITSLSPEGLTDANREKVKGGSVVVAISDADAVKDRQEEGGSTII